MGERDVNRLAGEVRKYIERVLPQLERTGGFPDSPMDRDAKGESNPPVGERAMLLWYVNRDASRVINPILEELRRGRHAYGGHQYRDMLERATYDSGAFARWLGASNAGPKRRQAFWTMCLHIARVAIIRHGDTLTLDVQASPDATADDEVVWDTNSVAPKQRRITKVDKYRDVAARCERIRMEHPAATEKAVWKMCSEELEALGRNGSVGMIRVALEYVKSERGDGNGEAA